MEQSSDDNLIMNSFQLRRGEFYALALKLLMTTHEWIHFNLEEENFMHWPSSSWSWWKVTTLFAHLKHAEEYWYQNIGNLTSGLKARVRIIQNTLQNLFSMPLLQYTPPHLFIMVGAENKFWDIFRFTL